MKSILLAGAALLLVAGTASAQIQSPSQPGMTPPTGVAAQGSAAGNMGSSGMAAGMPARNTRQMSTQRARRPARMAQTREADRAYMGGGMILENGRPVDMPMMPDRGVGTARGLPNDPARMGSNRMPGGTGTGAGAGATGSGGN
ncbi:hypothetical protein ACI6QG_16995 [Roseococcus sp. DSY-14]|uniref:hypothetical protein n=1 Tax=Roseococcus sp. DSY-14 TaxID=3369650 RepID=UPI00387B3C32